MEDTLSGEHQPEERGGEGERGQEEEGGGGEEVRGEEREEA